LNLKTRIKTVRQCKVWPLIFIENFASSTTDLVIAQRKRRAGTEKNGTRKEKKGFKESKEKAI